MTILLALLVACNVDSVAANGVLGNLTFTLSSASYLDSPDLTQVDIVTGHPQVLSVGTSDAGERRADGREGLLSYRMSPSEGVTVEQGATDADSGSPPALWLTASQPGDYVLEATLDGEVFDYVLLGFAAPTALEVPLFVRAPYAETFLPADAPLQVEEGTQLAWLPIPLRSGERLAGEVAASITADPVQAVVPAANVDYVNEDEVYSNAEAPSLYFIEPGEVTLTVSDDVNDASETVRVTVVAPS
jgi:hypothetical protein